MKLLERVRHQIRLRHLAYSTEECYLSWVELFIRFHRTAEGWRHPGDTGVPEVEAFLTDLAVNRRVSASTQNQALSAVSFLYRDVLKIDLGDVDAIDQLDTREPYAVLSPLDQLAIPAGAAVGDG